LPLDVTVTIPGDVLSISVSEKLVQRASHEDRVPDGY
jgi:hypothetical protein